jgi:hypothetical protein
MKQLVGRAVSELLYCLGDCVSRPMYYWDWAWIYPVYNWLMDSSHGIQNWAGNNAPWQPDTIKEENK